MTPADQRALVVILLAVVALLAADVWRWPWE
jgi:hypothetical protein